jgi:hypothetical protein
MRKILSTALLINLLICLNLFAAGDGVNQNLSVNTAEQLAGIYTLGLTNYYDELKDGDTCDLIDASAKSKSTWIYDADSGASESERVIAPKYTTPGNAYTGNARWVRIKLITENDASDVGAAIAELSASLDTDHTYESAGSLAHVETTAGLSGAFGQLVVVTGNAGSNGPIVKLADADSSTTVGKLYVLVSQVSGSHWKALRSGQFRDESLSMTTANDSIGKSVYVSTTEGGFTVTAPSGSGDQVQKVGYVIDDNVIDFSPSVDITEIAAE